MRQKIIAAVWKDRLTNSESNSIGKEIAKGVNKKRFNFDVVIVPSAIALADISQIISGTTITLAAQHMDWMREEGSYIGEITAHMLVDVGCKYVMVGHSERRRFFGETDEKVNRRIRTALDFGLIPIICIGITLSEKEAGLLEQIVDRQIAGALEGLAIDGYDLSKLLFAFEPVWAISTWREKVPLPDPELIDNIHQYVRQVISEHVPASSARQISVVYGGSVNPDNAEGYFCQPHIDGALVGGASLSARSFLDVVAVGKKVYG